MNIDFDNALELYKELNTPGNAPQPKDDFVTCCKRETVVIDSNRTCIVCGLAVEEFVYVVQTSGGTTKKRAQYKKGTYFKHILELVSCRKLSQSPKYNGVVDHLRNLPFETIPELRSLMKTHKYNKFYPYIFVIYFDIKKTKLINLSTTYFYRFLYEFGRIEHHFKLHNHGKKRTMLSYHFIIYSLLKKHKMDCFKFIQIPTTSGKLEGQLAKFLIT